MIMITGGAFQGKREYVRQRFRLSDSDFLDCGKCSLTKLKNARCICNYELAVKRMLAVGIDPISAANELRADIVIMSEIGCGIIPLDKSEREWREMTGRAGCIIAERASEVVRLCCGIPKVIKGEKR